MEKTVTVAYEEYKNLVESVEKQSKMLKEVHNGGIVVEELPATTALDDCSYITLGAFLRVYSQGEVADVLIKANIKLKAENGDLKKEIKLQKEQFDKNIDYMKNLSTEILMDISKIPSFVRRLFGVK